MAGERASVSTLVTPLAEMRAQRSALRRALYLLWRNRLGLLGAVVLSLVTLGAILAPVLSPHDPMTGDITKRLTCPVLTRCPAFLPGATPVRGSLEHPLGTDQLGRDIFARIVHGARVSLIVGLAAVLLGAGFGSTLGLLSGYYGGRVDAVIMRIGDLFLAFPYLLLAIAIVAVLGGGLFNVIVVLAIATWVPYARIMRGSVLSAKEREYVIAARAIGVRDATLVFRHIAPNCVSPIIVFGTFNVAAAIIAEAGLSFLGLGVGATRPTWGNMLADGRAYVATAWWLATFPGLAIMLTVLAINMIGDWLRDALDPHLRNIE